MIQLCYLIFLYSFIGLRVHFPYVQRHISPFIGLHAFQLLLQRINSILIIKRLLPLQLLLIPCLL